MHTFLSKRILPAFLALIMLLSLFMTQVSAATPTFFYIQTTVSSEWGIASAVIKDECSSINAMLEAQRVNADAMKSLGSGLSVPLTGATGQTPSTRAMDSCLLTFPGRKNAYNNAGGSSADYDRASQVQSRLVTDFNTAIRLAWPNRKDWDHDTFVSNISALVSAAESGFGTVGAVTISDANSSDFDLGRISSGDSSLRAEDYVAVSTGDGSVYYLCWRMPKGYFSSSGRDVPLEDPSAGSQNEAEYITWRGIAYEALQNSQLQGDKKVTEDTVYEKQSVISNLVVNILWGISSGIRGFLNLWNLDELIYSCGIRGSSSYVHGVFPASWEPLIWAFFAVFDVIAILYLFFSVASIALKRALSTANLMGMRHAWEQVKDLITIIVFLSLLPFLLQVMLSLSNALTGIFYAALGGETICDLRNASGNGLGTIAGCIMQILFLGMDLYFNFFYILRAITVAVLICISPICIIAATFDMKYKAITSMWIRELAANIFIQPIQAFLFALIVLLPITGHFFDTVIMMYAVIPFTSTIRSLFFGSAGNMSDNIASNAKSSATSALTGAAVGAASAVGGMAAGVKFGHDKSAASGVVSGLSSLAGFSGDSSEPTGGSSAKSFVQRAAPYAKAAGESALGVSMAFTGGIAGSMLHSTDVGKAVSRAGRAMATSGGHRMMTGSPLSKEERTAFSKGKMPNIPHPSPETESTDPADFFQGSHDFPDEMETS